MLPMYHATFCKGMTLEGGTKGETRLSERTLLAMEKSAKRNGRTLSHEIRMACYAWLKSQRQRAPP